MSAQDIARRTSVGVSFGGVNIANDIMPYLISLTYTDVEDGETDDLQIVLQDRNGEWLNSKLEMAINAAASPAMQEPAEEQGGGVSLEVGNVVYFQGTTHYSYSNATSGYPCTPGPAKIVQKYDGRHPIALIHTDNTSNVYGWVDVADIRGANTASVSTSSTYTVTAQIGLNVRSGPGTAYARIGGLAYGAAVEVSSISNGWATINYNGSTAYVCADYLQASGGGSGGGSSTATPATGLTISAAIVRKNWVGNGKDELLDCGQFELDSVSADGPPSTITIKATALPFTSTIRQTEKSKAWEARNLSSIAAEIARLNGMSCMYESGYDPYYARAEQYKISDIRFLSKLCEQAGISLKASNNILILFDQAAYERRGATLTIRYGDKSYIKYKLGTGKANTEYTSCRVSYVTPDGRCISATAYVEDYNAESETNQQLEKTAKVSSVGEAQMLAEKYLRMYNKYQQQVTFTLPGDPAIAAGTTCILGAFGFWSGKYIIQEARHTVSRKGYTTQIKCRRVLEGY